MPIINGRFVPAEDLPYGPGNPDYEHDAARQDEVDAEAEAKRAASGMTPEALSLRDAFNDGQKAGMLGLAAGLNPYDHSTPEYAEWERARSAIIGARLAGKVRAA